MDHVGSSWPASFEELLERAKSKTPADREAERQRAARENFEAYQERIRHRAIERCRALSEIGARFEERTFANFVVTDGNRNAYLAAQEIAEISRSREPKPPGGYFFSVEPGIGKTHLAGAIVNDCVASGIPAVFTTGVGLLMRIRNSYNRRGDVRDGEHDIINRLAEVRVLVLDDVGTEHFTVDTGRLLYALINSRYERNLGIIATSNLSIASLAIQWSKSGVEEHVGNKIIDRLREMCSYKVELSGESRRGLAQ